MNELEVLGVIITLASLWLMIKEYALGWIMSIAGCLIYVIIYWQAKLYSNAELQFIYIAVSVYGFSLWKNNTKIKSLPITLIANNKFVAYIPIVLFFGLASGYMHSIFTESKFSYLDATLTSTCVVAQWMMARKYLQCWYLWIAANVGYIVLYFQASLWGTLILFTIVLFLNIHGFLEWRKLVLLQTVKQDL